MIFGFNTDIKHNDTVYHVQSEARENELLLQTQVFVRGRCVGKRATPYADKATSGGFTNRKKSKSRLNSHALGWIAIGEARLMKFSNRGKRPKTWAPINRSKVQW